MGLTQGIPPDVCGGVQSLSAHAVAYQWRSLPRVRWHRVSIVLKVVQVTGGAAFVCVCVCVFIKLHITTQSGPVILVILCHSH